MDSTMLGIRDFSISNGELSHTQIRALGLSEDGIERYRKTYQFLHSALWHGGTWRLGTTLLDRFQVLP